MDETKLTARLPNLEVEIIRREDPAQNAEMLTLNFRAVPSFEAFGRYLLEPSAAASPLAAAGPFGLWFSLWQNAFAPWIEAATLMQRGMERLATAEATKKDRSASDAAE